MIVDRRRRVRGLALVLVIPKGSVGQRSSGRSSGVRDAAAARYYSNGTSLEIRLYLQNVSSFMFMFIQF